MKRIKLISILLGLLLSWSMNAQQRIVGGSNINITEAPWQVIIQTKGEFTGGGSILSPNLILTASHVIDTYTASEIKVGVGTSKLSNMNSSSLYAVSKIIKHPSLDIALLVLTRSLSYTSNVKAIDILSANKSSYFNIGNSVSVTGWGITILPEEDPFNQAMMSNDLKKVNLSIVSNSVIAEATNSDITTFNKVASPSKGDSGGALTIWDSSLQKNILIGTVRKGGYGYCMYVRSSSFLDFLLPYYPVSISGGSDQVCSSSTFSVSYPNASVNWSCTGPLRITSQSNTSCTVSSTGDGPATLKATITSGSYTKTVERKLISGGYTSCMILYRNSVNGNSDTWCTSHSGNIFTIESEYALGSYEVRLKKYPGLQVVMTTTASKGDNTLNYMLSPGWYTMEARLLGCKNGDWVTAGEVEAVDCSSNYNFSLTPNPATHVVTLTLDDVNTPDPRIPATFTAAEGGKYEVQIWSETSLMKQYTFDRPTVEIPVSDLNSGRYFVLVFVNGKKLTQQLIIK